MREREGEDSNWVKGRDRVEEDRAKEEYCEVICTRFLILDRLEPVYKLGLSFEDWIPHVSVGSKIKNLGLALRVGSLIFS